MSETTNAIPAGLLDDLAAEEFVEEQGPILDPDERYEAVLKGFGHHESAFGPRLVWQFAVEDPESGETVDAAAFTSYSKAKGNKTSNLVKFSEALYGGELPKGTGPKDLIGLACRVDVDNYVKSKTDITKNKVVDVKPSKRKAEQAAAKAEAEDFDAIDV